MPNGTVQTVKSTRDWSSNQYGPFRDYVMDFKNNETGGVSEVYMTRKPDSPAPQPGETFDFVIAKNDQHGIKIKKEDTGGGFQGGGYSGGGGRNDDAVQDSIERQVSAKVAGQLLSGTGDLAKFEQFANAIREWIKGEQLAAPVAQQAPVTQTGAPADASGLQPGQISDDDIPF